MRRPGSGRPRRRQAAKRGWPVWAWLLLGLAVLVAAGAVVAAVVVAGGEDTAVVNTHTAEAGEPALISVPGYAYEDLTGDDLATFEEDIVPGFTSVNEALSQSVPELGDLYLGWSGHTVVAEDGEDRHPRPRLGQPGLPGRRRHHRGGRGGRAVRPLMRRGPEPLPG